MMVQQLPTAPQQQPEEMPNYWAGNEELTNFLGENGVSSVEELLQYTAGQEQSAEQMQQIFEFAMHPDPEIRNEFWTNYQEALEEQGLVDSSQGNFPASPSLPGTPAEYHQYNNQQPGFQSPEQFAQQFTLMNSGLPGITPQALAEFDRQILMTPGSFWAQNVFDFGDI